MATKPDADTSELFSEQGSGTMVLMAEDIVAMAKNRRLIVDGFDPYSIQGTSYDLRIGKKAVQGGQGTELDLDVKPLMIEPGSYAGIISLEKIKLPNNVFAQLGSKRKFSYDGLILLTGTIIDPGYEGYLLFGLYNASTKKVVLPKGTKICNVIFQRLSREVQPVSPDPYLLQGNFPPDFLTKMANVEVLPWNKISEEVRRIQELTQAVLDLKAQYNDVLEPIKDLTRNVDKTNRDVASLAEHGDRLSQLVNETSLSVKSLSAKVGDQDKELRSISTKLGSYGLLVKIAWAIGLIVLGSVIGGLVKQYVFVNHPPGNPIQKPNVSVPHP